MTSHVAFYTFNARNNTTFRIGQMLKNQGYTVYFLSKNPISQIQEMSKRHVLHIGLGDFMKSAKRIRIETTAINRFGNNILVPNGLERYEIEHIFKKSDLSYISSSTTNGKCNRAMYLLAVLLSSEQKSIFLHIPKSFDVITALEYIIDVASHYE